MMKHQRKLTSQEQQQQHALGHEQSQQAAPREFGSVEELLRHDALHTPVPPTIAHRLEESIRSTPAPALSWWRRLFGGSRP